MEKDNVVNKIIPILFLLIGLFIFLYPSILSLGTVLPADESDTNQILYVLEHGYLFVHQITPHTSLFDLPFFFPHINTLSYSDMMLGGMLIYVPIRELVNTPYSAYLIWIFATCILNYISMYLLLSRIFNFKQIPASLGAVLFAFGLPRSTALTHGQLLLQFYAIFSLFFFLSFSRKKSKIYNNCCLLLGSIFFAVQFYSTFYFGYYMVLGAVISFFIMLFSKNLRVKLFDFIKEYKYELILHSLIIFTLLIPLLKHYLAVGVQFDYPNCCEIRTFPITSVFVSNSIADKIFFNVVNVFSDIQLFKDEAIMGIGYIISLFVLIGILKDTVNRKQVLIFILIVLAFFTNTVLNKILYYTFPGTSAIRGGGRIIFLLLPIYSYYLAYFTDWLFEKKNFFVNKITKFIIILFIFFELIPSEFMILSIEKMQDDEEYPMQDCNIIGFDIEKQVSSGMQDCLETKAMWYSLNNKKYTVNGFSGHIPDIEKNIIPDSCRFKIQYKE